MIALVAPSAPASVALPDEPALVLQELLASPGV